MRIIEDGDSYFVVNPDTGERTEVDPSIYNSSDGRVDSSEMADYIANDLLNANETRRAYEVHLRDVRGTVTGNTELDSISEDEFELASREIEAGTGHRISDSPLFNLKERARTDSGGRVLTSGVPGSDDRSRSSLEDEYPELSEAAIDYLFAYKVQNVRYIYSLSRHGIHRSAIEELYEHDLIDDGFLNYDEGTVNCSNKDLTNQNMQILAEAYKMRQRAAEGSNILFRSTHGAHRAVFTMVGTWLLEHDGSTVEEALAANGVPSDFISSYPGFESQLMQIPQNRQAILRMVN